MSEFDLIEFGTDAKKYHGLLHVPATDPNFQSGLERLDTSDLKDMLKHMDYLTDQGESHKGRIKAVEKELKARGGAAEPKRGRKALAGENSKDIIAVDKMQENIETAERLYADGMPYEIDRIENEIRFYQAQAGQSLLEMGKRFIRIKAHEDHGRFMRALENVGTSQRGANYAMAAARKFSNSQTFANLGQSKQIVLTVLDDDSIQTLEDGGEVKGVTLDDIERMSVRELKETLRKERNKLKENRGASDKAIFMKEKKISELEAQLRYQEPPTQEQLAAVSLEPLKKKLFEQVLLVQFHLDEAVKAVVQAQKVEGATFPQLQEWAMTHYEQLAPIGELFDELDKALVNCGPYSPESTGM